MKSKFTLLALLMLVYASISFAQIQINGSGNYSSVQAAIDSASDGSIITVPAGTSFNGFSIVGRNNLIVRGTGAGTTVINPSALISTGVGHKYIANMSASVFVNNSINIIIDSLTIQSTSVAPGAGGADGIVFWNASTGSISYCVINGIYTINGNQTGQGIAVDASSGQTTSLSVTNTTISGFQKNGIDAIDGNTSTGSPGNITFTVNGCTITGAGATSAIAQNGVLTWNRGSGSVLGTVNNTTISGIDYTPNTDAACGILTYGTSNANIFTISGTTFTNTEVYISTVSGADVDASSGNTFDGVQTSSATNSQLFTIETKIDDKLDDPAKGLVTLKTGNLYVPAGDSIQTVIGYASPGDTITVEAGTYPAFTINQPITLIGSNGSIINHGSPAITVSSTGVVINGFTFNFDAPDYAIDVLAGNYNVTILNCDFLNTNLPAKGNGVRNQGTGTVTATHNYWGDPSGPTVASSSCGSGAIITNSSSGSITYSPWYVDYTPHTTLFSGPVLTTPANLATGVTITPNFVWSQPYGSSSTFTIEIATDNTFSNVVYGPVAATSPYQLPDANKLDNGTIYYWRITASDSGGTSCAAGKFTTIAPATPVLTNPMNLSTISGNIIYFAWYSGMTGIQYRLYLSTSSSFSSYVSGWDTSYTASTNYNYVFNYSTLPAGTYYWRVKSFTQTGVLIGISSTWQFEIPGPPTAIPSYPTGGTTVYTTSPTIYWYLNNYYYQSGVKYKVLYGTTSDTSAPYTYTDSTAATTNLYATLSGLNVGSTYYYRIKASVDNFATFTWSLEESFVVFYSSPTGVPIYLAYPIGGTYVYTSTPTLYWYLGLYIPGVSFDIQVDNTSNSFSSLVVDTSGVSGYYFTTSSLPDGTYYWRVRLTGTTTWYSDSFVIDASTYGGGGSSATIPTPLSPIGGTVVTTQSPSLSWYAYSSSSLDYQVIWSSDPTLSSGVLTYTSSPNGGSSGWLVTTSYNLSGLTPGVTYYWQVRSRLSSSPSTVSDYSTVGQFTVSPGASPVVVLPANPISGININSTAANMSWVVPAKSNAPLLYDLEISKEPDMSLSQVIKDLSQPSYKATNLDANTTYYWRVKSKTSDGASSPYSYKGQFSTGTVTGIEEIKIIPMEFSLSQNYPNPFNPSTIINYALPKNSFVTLKIYNLLGQEIRTLVSQEMNAGSYAIEWDGSNNSGAKVATGVYIYRITAGSFISVKKMLLMK